MVKGEILAQKMPVVQAHILIRQRQLGMVVKVTALGITGLGYGKRQLALLTQRLLDLALQHGTEEILHSFFGEKIRAIDHPVCIIVAA